MTEGRIEPVRNVAAEARALIAGQPALAEIAGIACRYEIYYETKATGPKETDWQYVFGSYVIVEVAEGPSVVANEFWKVRGYVAAIRKVADMVEQDEKENDFKE